MDFLFLKIPTFMNFIPNHFIISKKQLLEFIKSELVPALLKANKKLDQKL